MIKSFNTRYSLAVYSLIVAIAAVLFLVAKSEGRWDAFFINMATELLGAVLVIFIIHIIFKLSQEKKICDQFHETDIKTFLAHHVDFNDVGSIDIIGHTGEQLILRLFAYMADYYRDDADKKDKLKEINIRILLRSPAHETGKRARKVATVVESIEAMQNEGFKNIQFHFYQNLPMFRAIMCSYKGRTSDRCVAFLSFYYFPKIESQSKHYPETIIIDEKKDKKHHLVQITKAWFENYWGKSSRRHSAIHTVILDFDDTIVNSHEVQINAWLDIIDEIKKRKGIKPDNFQRKIRETIFAADGAILEPPAAGLKEAVTRIFFDRQGAEGIYQDIFCYIDEELKAEIHRIRFQKRRENMGRATVFPGFENMIHNLAPKYDFIIVSATDENLIREYLNAKNLTHYFRYIFGKTEPIFDWKKIERKSRILLKIVSILGIPISRLVYMGDNNNDYVASRDIGIDFIEARLFEDELLAIDEDKPSLIRDGAADNKVTAWSEFENCLKKIERHKVIKT
ncbi:MAG: HAD family hydrolase [bacterium]|nr:HAD family hydrolase [bacterium]